MTIYIIYILIVILVGLCYYTTRKPSNYPPGPKWLPFIGNTLILSKLSKKLGGHHLAYEYFMNKYKSPIIGLKLGLQNIVVIHTYSLVKSALTNENLDARPVNYFVRLRNMGTKLGITFANGKLWSEQRSFTTKHLRHAGYGRTEMENQIQNELLDLINVIEKFNEKPIWPAEFLPMCVISVVWSLVAGERIEKTDTRLISLMELFRKRAQAFDMSGGLLNTLPWLRYISPEKTGYNLINEINKNLYKLFIETITEHKKKFNVKNTPNNLIDAYLKEMDEQNIFDNQTPETNFTELQLIMIILDLFIAASQTVSTTLDLAFMTMCLWPNVQKRVNEELTKFYQNDINQVPKLEDRTYLPYTEAVLLEIQRYYHIAVLAGPRIALNDIHMNGYCIPKDTTVFISLRSVHNDEKYWGDPDVFRPERFLNEKFELIDTERMMPFGLGRRKCLGESFAKSTLFILFVGLVKKFEILRTDILPSKILNPGLILTAKPYKIIYRKRY